MLANLSNHPVAAWSAAQLAAAAALGYGKVVDIPFPEVDPAGDKEYIAQLAQKYAEKILNSHADAVHVMGEQTFCYEFLCWMRSKGIKCFASTTRRNVTVEAGVKKSVFEFVGFREYF